MLNQSHLQIIFDLELDSCEILSPMYFISTWQTDPIYIHPGYYSQRREVKDLVSVG